MASSLIGVRRVEEIFRRFGLETVLAGVDHSMRIMREEKETRDICKR
jgi:N-methylhydantoinase B/oxoprolinase/acetone carboxylase alpha subunit